MAKKTLNAEQVAALAHLEPYFETAIRARWCRYPGEANIRLLLDTWRDLTGTNYPYNAGCTNCLLNLVRDLGTLYRQTKDALEQDQLEQDQLEQDQKPAPKKPAPKTAKASKSKTSTKNKK